MLRRPGRLFVDPGRSAAHAFLHPMRAVLGLSFGSGIIVYQIAKSGDGLARIEIGRSKFRHTARPSYMPSLALSIKYAVAVETPLSF